MPLHVMHGIDKIRNTRLNNIDKATLSPSVVKTITWTTCSQSTTVDKIQLFYCGDRLLGRESGVLTANALNESFIDELLKRPAAIMIAIATLPDHG